MKDELMMFECQGLLETFIDYLNLYGSGRLVDTQSVKGFISRAIQVANDEISRDDGIDIIERKITTEMNNYYKGNVDQEIKKMVDAWIDLLDMICELLKPYYYHGNRRTKKKFVLSKLINVDSFEVILYIPQ